MAGLCASPTGHGGSQVSFRDFKHNSRRKMLSAKETMKKKNVGGAQEKVKEKRVKMKMKESKVSSRQMLKEKKKICYSRVNLNS
jgi:hypothetical protein